MSDASESTISQETARSILTAFTARLEHHELVLEEGHSIDALFADDGPEILQATRHDGTSLVYAQIEWGDEPDGEEEEWRVVCVNIEGDLVDDNDLAGLTEVPGEEELDALITDNTDAAPVRGE